MSLLPQRLKILFLNSNLIYFSWSLFSNFVEQLRGYFNGPSHSFSQTGEDLCVMKFLPEKNGSYIDVGCGQPIHGSNTYFLYKKGWSGVVVDPILNNSRLFKILRPRDNFKRVLIGKKGGKAVFFEIIPYVYSTTSLEFAQKWLSEGRKIKSETQLSLNSLSEFTPSCSPLDPSFLSIDIEGMELECLGSIDFEHYSPRVICIEEWEETLTNGKSLIRDFVSIKNYRLVDRTSLSSIFVHSEYLDSYLEATVNSD